MNQLQHARILECSSYEKRLPVLDFFMCLFMCRTERMFPREKRRRNSQNNGIYLVQLQVLGLEQRLAVAVKDVAKRKEKEMRAAQVRMHSRADFACSFLAADLL